jgi:hypothetical protein
VFNLKCSNPITIRRIAEAVRDLLGAPFTIQRAPAVRAIYSESRRPVGPACLVPRRPYGGQVSVTPSPIVSAVRPPVAWWGGADPGFAIPIEVLR